MKESFFQPGLFGDQADSEPVPVLDISAVADHIARHAPTNPYTSQERRNAEIINSRGEDLGAEQTGFKDSLHSNDATEDFDPAVGLTPEQARQLNQDALIKRGGRPVDPKYLN